MLARRALSLARPAARRGLQYSARSLQLWSAIPRSDGPKRTAAVVLSAALLGAAAAFATTSSSTDCAASNTGKCPRGEECPCYPNCKCGADCQCGDDHTVQVNAPEYLTSAEEFFYPPIEPYKTGTLKVSDKHTLYYEECGNPNGKPVVILHGGPGGGCNVELRRYHDPKAYRIILFDQRGCGRSTPHACLEDNTTWHLVGDIERLRQHLKIDKWQVFGGSWGSTLAVTYAETHSTCVTELVLRGIFLLRKQEIDFYYQHGSNFIYPDRWEGFRDAIPEEERGDFVKAYHKRLTSNDQKTRLRAAAAWATWELCTSNLIPPPPPEDTPEAAKFAEAFARIENHYFINKGFFPTDNFLLDNVHKIRDIPTIIVQGRYDCVCPIKTAWDLHRAFPESYLRIIQTAGHSAMEPGIVKELVAATDRFREPRK